MEKGFNDDELADIMNEIESLEKEFSTETQEKKEPQNQMDHIESETDSVEGDFESEFKAKEDHKEVSIMKKLIKC